MSAPKNTIASLSPEITANNVLSTGTTISNRPKNGIIDLGSQLSVDEFNTTNKFQVENGIHIDPDCLNYINQYKGSLIFANSQIQGKAGTSKRKSSVAIFDTISTASLFNPNYVVKTGGSTPGVPLLDTSKHGDQISAFKHNHSSSKKNVLKRKLKIDIHPDDCSIKRLVELSKMPHSPLGNARYKYTDFMYCRDVGKMSNNHLITLRRFATPVSDNIFRATTLVDEKSNIEQSGDIGRLVTWFGTEENKLEDILKFNYKATWKKLEAKIQELPSQETEPDRGVLGGFVNLFNPQYQADVARGVAPSALSLILGDDASDSFFTSAPYKNNPAVNGSAFDKNKVYEPKDSIRWTHTYDGALEFTHSFTLVFNYKLRGYDNINAKSAFLDLIGNILAVTYKQGTFWPGEQRITGPKPSKSGWNKAQAFSGKVLDAGGTFIGDLMSGKGLADAAKSFMGNMGDALGSIGLDCSSLSAFLNSGKEALMKQFTKGGGQQALKGLMQNAMGRPAVYAFDSLLTNDVVGTWHVTIGNPLNPIASFGNLIIEDCELQHLGPLGLDDFPTELKLTISLQHAMPRDSVDIQRMYTQGRTSIYSKISNKNNVLLPDDAFTKNTAAKSAAPDDKASPQQITGSEGQSLVKNLDSYIDADSKISNVEGDPKIGWLGENSSARWMAKRDIS